MSAEAMNQARSPSSPAAVEWRRRLEQLCSLLRRYPFGPPTWRLRLEMRSRVLTFLLSQYGTRPGLRLRDRSKTGHGSFWHRSASQHKAGKPAHVRQALLKRIVANNESTPRGDEPCKPRTWFVDPAVAGRSD